ncbi:hypothetical protein N9R79_02235 [Vibrio sp.]|nr:hypothetical protein [Vibrio sp.]
MPRFVRAFCISNALKDVNTIYNLSFSDYHMNHDVIANPMTLIPHNYLCTTYDRITQLIGNKEWIRSFNKQNAFIHSPFRATVELVPDLIIALQRLNYIWAQSDSAFHVRIVPSGKIACITMTSTTNQWHYAEVMRQLTLQMDLLRFFLGDSFIPLKIEIPIQGITTYIQNSWDCPVTYHHKRIAIWLHSHSMTKIHPFPDVTSTASLFDARSLDQYINMPDPENLNRCVGEVINFLRYTGRPTIHAVAEILGMNHQQLQRRLSSRGTNFKMLCNFALMNQATNYLYQGLKPELFFQKLGYTSIESFNKAFKRERNDTKVLC